MNFIKSPQDMLFEEAGMRPASPGPLNTPQQALMDRTIPQPLMPMFAQPSPQDMQAMMVAMGQTPQKFNSGGGVMGTNYRPEYNPEATFEPQDRSSYTLRTRDKLAEFLSRLSKDERFGERTADEIFGTGSGGMGPWVGYNIPSNLVKSGVQMFNPVAVATDIMDAPKQAIQETQAGDPLSGGLTLSFAGLGALPYVGPSLRGLKKLGSKISKKIKE